MAKLELSGQTDARKKPSPRESVLHGHSISLLSSKPGQPHPLTSSSTSLCWVLSSYTAIQLRSKHNVRLNLLHLFFKCCICGTSPPVVSSLSMCQLGYSPFWQEERTQFQWERGLAQAALPKCWWFESLWKIYPPGSQTVFVRCFTLNLKR